MKNYFILLFAVLFLQCKTNTNTVDGIITLSFNMEDSYPSVAESEYEFLYHFIPLETKEECLLGKIFNIKKFNNYLYIHSIFNKSVMIFSTDGKFIKKIPTGRGPGEIMDPLYMVVDEKNNQLEILDYFRHIKIFSLEGEYIKSQECDASLEFEKIDDHYLFHIFTAKNQKYCFKTQNTQNEIQYFLDFQKTNKAPFMFYSHLFKTDSTIYFHTDFNHTVYRISGNDLTPKPYAIISHQCTADKIKPLSESEINSYCMSQNLYINMLNFNALHEGHTLYAEMITENDVEAFLYNVDNHKIYRVNNGINGCISGSSENYQYKSITPGSIEYHLQDESVIKNKPLYEKLTQLASTIQEEDNPVIVEIEIKKKS